VATEGEGSSPSIDDVVQEIVNRIVRVAHPRTIVLFGSAARGEMRPDSDLDFLVIVAGPVHRGRLTQAIYLDLIGVGYPADIVVVDTDDVVRYRGNRNTVIGPALDEGKIVYAA
jgi:predicted nucleotidyltransferase